MSKTVFILTQLVPFLGNDALSIIVAVRETKAEIEALQKGFLQQGKITGVRSVNINYYTLIIETGNAMPSLILATAKKRREPLDEAREIFKKLLPNAHIRVVQLRDVINLEHLPEVE